jgi:RNA polymerase sigma-70 factor (ECF subfamily)
MKGSSSLADSLYAVNDTNIARAEAATGQDQNFDRILREYGPALSRLAGSYEPVKTQRDDLLQEIALAIWRALPRFRGECSERTFIYRVAHNQGLSHAWRRHPTQLPLEAIAEHQEPVDPRPRPEELTAQQHQKIRLDAAIQSLPVAYRQIITLMLEDLSHAEIADVVGISENNVAVRLNRARKALKAALGAAS